jgi:hypothetical protein
MISHATRYVHLEDGVLATVTTRAASHGIVAALEHTFPCGTGADTSTAIPYDRLATKAMSVADSLAEAREALMRCGYAATCPVANTLGVFIPRNGLTDEHVATIYGSPEGLGISGTCAEPLSRVLGAEGVEVHVD